MIMSYVIDGAVEESADDVVQLSFDVAKVSLDKDAVKYAETCEKRRDAINSRWNKEKNTNEYKSIQEDTKHTDTDTDTDTDISKKSKTSSRMTRPTIEEVQAYITEKGYHVDAQRFIDYYESNGWKVGRNPMKDWKATVRTWENRDKQDKKNNANNKFRNFEEREYDYDSLEKQLLSRRRG